MGSPPRSEAHAAAVAWAPQPGPQQAAIECPVFDLLYGGAVGGGKSDFLLGDFAIHADKYERGARGILVRRTMPELEELILRSKEIFHPLGAGYQQSKATWTFPRGGTLKLRFLDRDADAFKYMGHQYSWLGVDEAGNFPSPDPIDKLSTRLRSAAGVPCRKRLTANPGGPGHFWLKTRYITPVKPWVPHKDPITGLWRVFIPSRLADNRLMAMKDPDYEKRVRGAGAKWLVKAWLEGDWSGMPTGTVLDSSKLVMVDKPAEAIVKDLGLRLTQYWDFAASSKQTQKDDPDYSACITWGRDELNRYWLIDAWRKQCDAAVTAQAIISNQRKWNALPKGEKGALEKMIQPVLAILCQQAGYTVTLSPIAKGPVNKVSHSVAFQMLLHSGNVHVPAGAPWLHDMMHEMGTFPNVGTGIHDDWIDCLSYAAQDSQGTRRGEVPKFGGVFHPEADYAALEHMEEVQKRRKGKSDEDEFWEE